MYKARVLVNDKPIKFYYDAESRIWVLAKYGSEYSIRIQNDSNYEIGAVIYVDGLNVIDAKSKEESKSAYIVNPFSSMNVEGWRISEDEVKKFVFSKPKKSYSNKLKKDIFEVGKIEIFYYNLMSTSYYSAYNDYIIYYSSPTYGYYKFNYDVWNPTYYIGPTYISSNFSTDPIITESSSTYPSSNHIHNTFLVDSDVGTGFGRKIESPSIEINGKGLFGLISSTTIFYGSKELLKKKGILTKKEKIIYQKFCPTPN